MAKYFGTNGIRGIFPKELTLEFIHNMTLAIAEHFQKGPILVGRDGRESSLAISKVVCSALNFAGLDCSDAGLVPTPCLEYSVKRRNYVGGIMITASHNPPQYNGIKVIAKDGVEISRKDELAIEDIFQRKSNLKYIKSGITKSDKETIPAYIKAITSQVNSDLIKSKKQKVVLDLGNGAQAVTAPTIFEILGCKVILINQNIDGGFPGRGPEPTPYNLSDLSKAVLQNNADLGIAFDGDGDRSIFCDEKGVVLTGDRSALLLSTNILTKNPGSTIVTCVNSGSSIEKLARKYDSQVIRTKVGSVEVSRKMISEKALIGFEENGGFMFGNHNQVRDGSMALALMLDLLARSEKSLSKLIADMPESYTTKDKIPCESKEANRVIKHFAEEFPDADTTDGIKITLNNNWVMIRPSGTEPIIRIYAEAENQELLNDLMVKYMQKIKSVICE